jgi:SAM-dependent methyltransferase
MKARLISPRLVRNTGRVLDVGCAAGFFLKVMKERGWWVNGIDICPEMARYAGKIAGRRGIHLGPADQSVWPADMFDLVTLWDTIEHVGDPVGLIRKCSIWLHQGGAICLETQDPESWLARLAGPRWHHYKPAEHLWHFPVRSLGRLLADQGFDDIRVTRRGAGRWVSWDYILTKAGRYLPVLRREKPAGIPGRFEWYVNPGDEYIMTAVKSGSVKKESGREKRIRL